MPELAVQETCLEALPSLQPFQSTDAPFQFHGPPAASGSVNTSPYYPSAFLQAGAVLAVHLAARNRPGQDPVSVQDYHDNGPAQSADPLTAAAGAGPGAGPGALGLGIPVDPSPNSNGTGIVPCRSDCLTPSVASFHLTGSLSLTENGMEAFRDEVTPPNTDQAHNSETSSPPRKRRRFEDKPPGHQHQHAITDITRESIEMGQLFLAPGFAPTVKPDSLLGNSVESTERKLEKVSSATADSPNLPTSAPASRPLGLVPERTPFSFFHFPGEIRNPIYSYSLHWPTTQELYRTYYRQLDEHYRYEDLHPDEPKRRPPTYKPKFRTPTILLLCRRVTSECLGILQSRTLVIDGMPPWQTGDLRPLPITNFIPKTTFQAIRRLEIRIPMGLGSFGSGWVWSDIACGLFDMLRESNSFEHLRVVFVIRYSPGNGAWRTSEQRHLELIDHSLVKLERENPNYKWPCKLEREYWIVEGQRASKAYTNSKGELHPSNVELRTYPDDEIWPGCVLDFV